MVFGADELMGQGAIVGEQQQTGGVLVQPSHRSHPLLAIGLWKQFQHGFLPPIFGGSEDAGRLVQ